MLDIYLGRQIGKQLGEQVGQGGRVAKRQVHEFLKKNWVKPFNWLTPHGPYLECENGKQRSSLYTFQNENGRQTLWDKF